MTDILHSTDRPGAIDVHCHSIPSRLLRHVNDGLFSDIQLGRMGQAPTFTFPGMASSPPAPLGLLEPDLRMQWCRQQAIDVQLVGPWTDLLGYSLPEGEASRWSRLYNECLVEECAGTPNAALATVPLSYPELAVSVLRHARDMGCVGTMVGTDIPGLDLGSDALTEFWETSEELGMPVVVHPTFMKIPTELQVGGLKNAVARAGTTALALAQLVYSGALVRHEGLQVIASHGGGGFVPLIPRIVRNAELGWAGVDPDVVKQSISALNVDSVVLDPNQVTDLVRILGPERVLLGSDYPFPWEPSPRATVNSSLVPKSAKRLISTDNSCRIFCHLCSS